MRPSVCCQVVYTYKASLPKPFVSDTTRGRWAGFTPREREWTHPTTARSLFGTLAARWWRSTTRQWVEINTQYTDNHDYKCAALHERMAPSAIFSKIVLWDHRCVLLVFTTAGQCCTSLCCTDLYLAGSHCSSSCWRKGAWMDLFVSIFRFPHAAEHVSIWVQRQNGLPAQARCPAPQWQEVWPFLWQDWHRGGQYTHH